VLHTCALTHLATLGLSKISYVENRGSLAIFNSTIE
jgi:hypothetical protein